MPRQRKGKDVSTFQASEEQENTRKNKYNKRSMTGSEGAIKENYDKASLMHQSVHFHHPIKRRS